MVGNVINLDCLHVKAWQNEETCFCKHVSLTYLAKRGNMFLEISDSIGFHLREWGQQHCVANWRIPKWPMANVVLAVVVAIWEGEEQEKRKKGPDRLWLKRRSKRGAFETIVRELSAEDTASYKSFMRMDVATFRNKCCRSWQNWETSRNMLSMHHGNTKCFCRVVETYFASRKQTL